MAFSVNTQASLLVHATNSSKGLHRIAKVRFGVGNVGFGSLLEGFESRRITRTRRTTTTSVGNLVGMVTADDSKLYSDLIMSLVTLSGALGSLKFFDELAKRDVFDKKLSRKLVHICVGLIFMLFWPLFSNAPRARYLAAIAPLTNAVRMVALGTGMWENRALVKAVSRGGQPSELLKGPLYYALTISAATLLFWRDSPISIVTIANLCAGDGFADIVGRKYGKVKLPYNPDKSFVGTIAMFVMSSAFSILYVALFSHLGYFVMNERTVVSILVVSLVTALVESLPVSTKLDDNLTVPSTAIAVGLLTLH